MQKLIRKFDSSGPNICKTRVTRFPWKAPFLIARRVRRTRKLGRFAQALTKAHGRWSLTLVALNFVSVWQWLASCNTEKTRVVLSRGFDTCSVMILPFNWISAQWQVFLPFFQQVMSKFVIFLFFKTIFEDQQFFIQGTINQKIQTQKLVTIVVCNFVNENESVMLIFVRLGWVENWNEKKKQIDYGSGISLINKIRKWSKFGNELLYERKDRNMTARCKGRKFATLINAGAKMFIPVERMFHNHAGTIYNPSIYSWW